MESLTPLSKANTAFSVALLKNLSDNDKTANIFYSPFSISSALAMVMMGARGNTATQMSEVQYSFVFSAVLCLFQVNKINTNDSSIQHFPEMLWLKLHDDEFEWDMRQHTRPAWSSEGVNAFPPIHDESPVLSSSVSKCCKDLFCQSFYELYVELL